MTGGNIVEMAFDEKRDEAPLAQYEAEDAATMVSSNTPPSALRYASACRAVRHRADCALNALVREQPKTGDFAARHCDGHDMRNVVPARGDGPSSVSAVSVHEATNAVGTNLSE